jgi:hypothetical protein
VLGALGEAMVGWVIVALAAMFGAPFWFDLLNRLVALRATARPPEKREEAATEDQVAGPPSAQPAVQATTPPPGTPSPAPKTVGTNVIVPPPDPDDPDGEGCGGPIEDATTPDEDLPASSGVAPVAV